MQAFLVFLTVAAGYGEVGIDAGSRMPLEIRALIESYQNGKPAFSIDEANAFAAGLIPLVENASKRRFKTMPHIRLADEESIKEPLFRELVLQIESVKKEWGMARICKEANEQVALKSPLILGYYSFLDKVLYLMPRQIEPLMKVLDLAKGDEEPIIKLTIAHELTHALQDQYIDFYKKARTINSPEAMLAFQSVYEGHAVFIQEWIGKALRLDNKMMEKFSLNLAGRVIMAKNPTSQLRLRILSLNEEMRYLWGKQFVEYHYSHGGSDKVWQILAKPPHDTAVIVNPTLYSPTIESTPDLAYLLKGLDAYFEGGEKLVDNDESVKSGLMILAFLSMDIRRKVLQKIKKRQMLSIAIDNHTVGEIEVFFLDDQTYGSKLIKILGDCDAKIHQAFGSYSPIKSDFVQNQKEMSVTGKGFVTVRYLHAGLLVSITSYEHNGMMLSKESIAKIYFEIIRRYDSSKPIS